jgi:transposase InsO family protein
MRLLYLLAGITRQGHLQLVKHQEEEMAKEPFFLGLIVEIREMHPGMGLRTIYEQFEPEGIGRDSFIALGLRNGFRLRAPQNPQITTRIIKNRRYANLLEGKRFTGVNQLWTSDIFYFSLQGRHYYGVLIMDVYSRRIVGWSMATNMRAENNVRALEVALALRGISNYSNKLIHHSDRGSQYVSDEYTELLKSKGILISMCKEVLENAHIERANGTIKNDYLYRWNIQTELKLFKQMDIAVNNYNNRRHRSLGMTPIQFETYVNELSDGKKPELEIFIYKQSVENPLQLQMNFEQHNG